MLILEVLGDISVTTRDIRNPQSFPELNWIEKVQLPTAAWNRWCAMIPLRLRNPTDSPVMATIPPEGLVKFSLPVVPQMLKNTVLIQLMKFNGDVVRESVVNVPMQGLLTEDGKFELGAGKQSDAWAKSCYFDKTAIANHRPVVWVAGQGFIHVDDPWFLTIAFDPDDRIGLGNTRPVAFLPVYIGSAEIRIVRNDPPVG